MRVFVAGASRAIGRRLVPELVAAGHEVTGMTRSEARAEDVRQAGARAAVVDVFDADALRTAVDEAGAVKDEDDPLLDDARGPFGGGVRALREMEAMVLGADEMEGLVLRYGFFYGPGTHYGEGEALVADVRRRRLFVVGRGSGVFSFIHAGDAADATVAAVERGAPDVYNVTDDEPAAMSEWVPVLAEAAGAKRPLRVPVWVAKLGGAGRSEFASELRGASNAKARRELGWQPAHASWRTGFRESLA